MPPDAVWDRPAVIGAMPEEIRRLTAALARPQRWTRGPFALHRGRAFGREVTVAECGVGKVNAAALAQQLLVDGATAVVFTGVAGAVDPSLRVGDVVVSEDAVQHDVDVTPLGYARGCVPGQPLAWPADAELRDAALAAAREAARAAGSEHAVVLGRVASGDQFIADAARTAALASEFGAACTEMEGAAVAQVCARWGVPWVIVRVISDTADFGASHDFRAFTELAAERAEAVVRGILGRLEQGA